MRMMPCALPVVSFLPLPPSLSLLSSLRPKWTLDVMLRLKWCKSTHPESSGVVIMNALCLLPLLHVWHEAESERERERERERGLKRAKEKERELRDVVNAFAASASPVRPVVTGTGSFFKAFALPRSAPGSEPCSEWLVVGWRIWVTKLLQRAHPYYTSNCHWGNCASAPYCRAKPLLCLLCVHVDVDVHWLY